MLYQKLNREKQSKNRLLSARLVTLALAAALLFCVLSGCTGGKVPAAMEQTAESGPALGSAAEPASGPAAEIAGAELKAGRHEREEGYQTPFNTRYIDTSFAAVHMEDQIFAESALREAAALLAADLRTVADCLHETPDKVTVYLVQHLDRPIYLNEHVVCTPDDLRSGAYREALCGACYGLSIPWKQVGLSAFVFGTIDESGLAEYYADEAHRLTASCAAVYLESDVADAETVEAARKTAQSITAYLMETGGLSAMRNAASTAAILPAWQEKLGISTPLTLPEGNEKAGAMTLEKNSSFLCTIHMDNITIRAEQGSFCNTADALYEFACRFWVGTEVVFDVIQREAPGCLAQAEERFSEPITIRFVRSGTVNWTYGYKIDLVNDRAVWHELMHILLAYQYDDMQDFWLVEGMADSFSYEAASLAMAFPDLTDDEFYPADGVQDEESRIFLDSEKNLYLFLRAQQDERLNGLYDYESIAFAYGICSLLLGDPMQQMPSVGDVRGYGYEGESKETDGRSLNYPETAVLFRYLADTYGMETVIRGNQENIPIAEICGKDYPELYADCVAWLNESYGSLLAVSD